MYFGCHLSTSDGYAAMVRTAKSLGADTFGFCTRDPKGPGKWLIDLDDVAEARRLLEEFHFGPIVAHGHPAMNLCAPNPDDRLYAASMLRRDLRRMSKLPGNYYTLHPGRHFGQGYERGIRQTADGLRKALAPGFPVTVLLETTAGTGSKIGRYFWELKEILDAVGDPSLGVCLNTCHVFAAGYDIVNDLDGVLRSFDREIGLDRLKALHLSDSRIIPRGSKDCYEKIGQGSLGLQTFEKIVNHPLLQGRPLILENFEADSGSGLMHYRENTTQTPDSLPGYREEIALLRSLRKN